MHDVYGIAGCLVAAGILTGILIGSLFMWRH